MLDLHAFLPYRAAAGAVSGNRPDFPSSFPTSHHVSTKIKTSRTSHWESAQGSGMICCVSLYFTLCFYKILKRFLLSFLKSSVQDPIPLVPLSLGTVDPCEIHLEFIPDHVSTEPFSGIVSNQNLNHKQGIMHSSNRLNYDTKSDEVYWDSGGMELGCGLDSGISIPPVSRSSEETCGPLGDWYWKAESFLFVNVAL